MRAQTIASTVLLALMLTRASEAQQPLGECEQKLLEVSTELDETRFLLMQRDRAIAAAWTGRP